ncbi:hypothetical protein [Acidipila rosea]|uniref:Peptidase M48-like protein n=1 Tax=Acidipila rosea TaxID=768535 RepID=A0A4R1LCF3_9BACT|nr:hypothetical protein [Acidipila rosea]TCK75287.1 hypothetical protein C7378_0267 [Acidipila rosea]
MSLRKLWMTGLTVTLAVTAANAKKPKLPPPVPLTADQTALIQKSIAQEKLIVKAIQKNTPVVQTYIQNTKPDPVLYSVPVSDQYMLGRVDFSKTFTNEAYDEKSSSHGLLKGSLGFLTGMGKALKMSYSSTGFMDMMFVDPIGYDRQHYDFTYVRRDFLGNVRTMVFDVKPKPHTGAGRFFGRIWVEDQDGNIVRFNGTYTSNANDEVAHYFHFDDWRANVQPGLWLPAAIYVEESKGSAASRGLGFHAQTHFWGYALKLPTRESDNESMQIDNAQDQSENSQDESPLQAKREWISQAEQNVLDRLTQAGLLAAPSDFDKILEQVAQNIIIGNNLQLPGDIHCRVMLTTPLETLAVGNTILVSKGLIDVLPYEEDLAAVLSFQLAHIALGHHIDTRYAFNDRLLFPDSATLERINMNHTASDDEAAAKRAVELFNHSAYKDKAANVGLFFQQLIAREKQLPALLTPRLGDSLVKEDGTPWLDAIGKQSPKLDMANLGQIAALPLGSHLKNDPWTDKVIQLNLRGVSILNPSDKLPFEITPIYFRLQRYQPPAQAVQQPQQTAPAANTTPQTAPAQAAQPQ